MKKVLQNGTMIFGIAPEACPPGYEATTDPRVFVPIMPECLHRTNEIITKQCCGKVSILFCDAFAHQTTRERCIKCMTKP